MLLIAPASSRRRSVLPKATIRATAWVTMASTVRCGDLRNMAEPSQRMAIARFARKISAIAKCGQAFYVSLGQREPQAIWLHSFSAGRTCDNAYLLAGLL